MRQRDKKWNPVDGVKEKSHAVDRSANPEPFFELELGGAHRRICSGGCTPLQILVNVLAARHGLSHLINNESKRRPLRVIHKIYDHIVSQMTQQTGCLRCP